MELVAKVEEEACRLARETASGCEGEVGSDQEVSEVLSVKFARDGLVVAGRASVFQDSAVVRGEPKKTEDSCVQLWVGGAEVMDRQVRFVDLCDCREMKERSGRVANCN